MKNKFYFPSASLHHYGSPASILSSFESIVSKYTNLKKKIPDAESALSIYLKQKSHREKYHTLNQDGISIKR